MKYLRAIIIAKFSDFCSGTEAACGWATFHTISHSIRIVYRNVFVWFGVWGRVAQKYREKKREIKKKREREREREIEKKKYEYRN